LSPSEQFAGAVGDGDGEADAVLVAEAAVPESFEIKQSDWLRIKLNEKASSVTLLWRCMDILPGYLKYSV
jgi:hypothetical protein